LTLMGSIVHLRKIGVVISPYVINLVNIKQPARRVKHKKRPRAYYPEPPRHSTAGPPRWNLFEDIQVHQDITRGLTGRYGAKRTTHAVD